MSCAALYIGKGQVRLKRSKKVKSPKLVLHYGPNFESFSDFKLKQEAEKIWKKANWADTEYHSWTSSIGIINAIRLMIVEDKIPCEQVEYIVYDKDGNASKYHFNNYGNPLGYSYEEPSSEVLWNLLDAQWAKRKKEGIKFF
jgi:hypothetical protein